MKKIFYSALVLVLALTLMGQVGQPQLEILEYLPEHPAMGTFDADPEHYEANDHHSTHFIALFASEFNGLNFANYVIDQTHWFHDHTWSIIEGDGHDILISCWQNYDNSGYDYIGGVEGRISEDWNTIVIDGFYEDQIFHRVTNKKFGPGRVEF